MSPVTFRSGAQAELKEAYHWYEEREPGLGADLIRCVDACLQLIRRHPEIHPCVYKNIRQAIVRRFPYSIFYLAEPGNIVVLSIFHASREPKKWKQSDGTT